MAPKKKAAPDEDGTTTIRVYRADQHRLKVFSAVNKVLMQEVVHQALEEYLKKRGA